MEVHSIVVRSCTVAGNATERGEAQIAIEPAAHDIVIHDCEISGTSDHLPGIHIARGVGSVAAVDNTYAHCVPVVGAEPLNRLLELRRQQSAFEELAEGQIGIHT